MYGGVGWCSIQSGVVCVGWCTVECVVKDNSVATGVANSDGMVQPHWLGEISLFGGSGRGGGV